jgi:hypothetical protein
MRRRPNERREDREVAALAGTARSHTRNFFGNLGRRLDARN